MGKHFRGKFPLVVACLLVCQLVFPLMSASAATTTTTTSQDQTVTSAATGTLLPPSNLASTMTTPSDVKLTWSAVYGASGYNVYQISNGSMQLLGSTTSASYTINNLPEGTYQYVVSTLDSSGESGPCAPVDVTVTYPTMVAPATLTNSIVNGNDIVLNWGASQYAQTYNVYSIADDGTKTLVTTTTARTYTVTNSPEGTFTYAVTAVHSLYGESDLSTPLSVTVTYPTMAAPTNLKQSVANGNDITLSWSGVSYATGYNVYQVVNGQNTLLSTVTGTSVTYTNQPAGDYTYEVHSTSTRFSESADGSQVSLTLAPITMAAPANLKDTIGTGNNVTLSWSSVQYATSYNVYQVVDGQKTLVTTVTGTSTMLKSLSAGDYTYEVHSNSTRFGESPDGSQVSFTVSEIIMAAPGNFHYTLTNGNNVALAWSSVPYATSYNVYRVVDGQNTLVSTVTGTSVSYTNLADGDYTYEVHSNSTTYGESADGSQVSFSIGATVMQAPDNLAYTINNGNDIALSWNAVSGATSYKVYQIVNGSKVLKSTVTGTGVTYTNMAAGDYTSEVHTYSSTYGESPDGASQVSLTLTFPTMEPPANVVQTVKDATTFSLSWDSAPYATSYKVYQIVNGLKVLKSTVTGTSVTYSNMAPGDYTYEVHAVSSRFGESPDGSTDAFTLVWPTMQPPTNLTQTIANGNDITLKWTGSQYANSYNIYVITNGQKTLKGTTTGTSVTYTNQPAGDYTFEVHAVSNRFGESPDGSTDAFTLVWPVVEPPTLQGTVVNANNLTLSWNKVAWANEYHVYEIAADGTKTMVYKGTALTMTLYNLSEATHNYEVMAYSNRFGESAASNELVEDIIYPVMQPPTASVTLLSSNSAEVSWTFATYANGYNLYEIVDGQPVAVAQNINNLSYTLTDLPYANHQYYVTSYSNSFGESAPSNTVVAQFIIDTKPPVTTASYPTTWTNKSATVDFSATDDITGVAGTYYSVNGSDYVAGNSVTVTQEGDNKVSYYSVDKAGNIEATQTIDVLIDQTAPVSQASAVPAWSNGPQTITLSATDALSGVATTYYSVNGSDYVVGNTVTVDTEGTNTVKYYSVDNAGNQEQPQTLQVQIDKTAPVTTATTTAPSGWTNQDVTVNLSATDALSGVANTYYSVDGSDYAAGNTVTISTEGTHKVTYYSVDIAGNQEQAQSIVVNLDKTAPVTTSDASSAWTNQDVTIHLSATDALSGVANTYFSVDGSAYTAGTTLTISTEGVHTVTYYSVDNAGNTEATETATVQIDKSNPNVAVNIPDEIAMGTKQTFNYTATDGLSGVANQQMTVYGTTNGLLSALNKNGQVVTNGGTLNMLLPGNYNAVVTATDAVGNTTTVTKQFVVYIPVNITVTAKMIKPNKGEFTVRVDLPGGYSTNGFDLDSVTLDGVHALNDNHGYYNQAKQGQFKFDRDDFTWTSSPMTMTFRGYVDGFLVIGTAKVIVQK